MYRLLRLQEPEITLCLVRKLNASENPKLYPDWYQRTAVGQQKGFLLPWNFLVSEVPIWKEFLFAFGRFSAPHLVKAALFYHTLYLAGKKFFCFFVLSRGINSDNTRPCSFNSWWMQISTQVRVENRNEGFFWTVLNVCNVSSYCVSL